MSDASAGNLDPPGAVREMSTQVAPSRGPRVLLLGPSRAAVSGVSTHLNQLFDSVLARHFELIQFQVGSEGRSDGRVRTLLRLLSSPLGFAACVIARRPGIVHINTSLEPKSYWRDLAYLITAKALRRKVVYQVHGGALPADFFAGRRALTSLLRRVLGWPDAVVLLASSEMSAYGSFAPGAHLRLIANAIASGDGEILPERYAADRPLRIVYMGRVVAVKGVFETLAAVRMLRDRNIDVQLQIAGSGPDVEELAREIARNALTDRVHLVGAVFGADKQQLWRSADVFAFPTYHREGLPYALLEAMAEGAVPVVSPVGAITDVMQDQVHGVLVPPKDPAALAVVLERLASDRQALYRMAVAGRARVLEQYSVARLARDFESLYTQLSA
jgi:glycosyltransferase involved in cell wall biosynthesis